MNYCCVTNASYFQDNAGTFDTLIPLLPENVSFLAIDLPGHGLSSQLPPGMYYHNMPNAMILIRHIQKEYGWNKVSLMGHSLGSMISFMFSSAYPDDVDLLVKIDFIIPPHLDFIHETRAYQIDSLLKCVQSSERQQPEYTMEELVLMWHEGSLGSIDKNNCKYILARNIKPSTVTSGKYFLTRDPRLRIGYTLHGASVQELVGCAEKLIMPVFMSKVEETPYGEKKEAFFKVLDVIKKRSKDCRFHMVDGTHHHHLNTPERISGKLTEFLHQYYAKEKLSIA